jgi:hypothetical protein
MLLVYYTSLDYLNKQIKKSRMVDELGYESWIILVRVQQMQFLRFRILKLILVI